MASLALAPKIPSVMGRIRNRERVWIQSAALIRIKYGWLRARGGHVHKKFSNFFKGNFI